MCRTFIKWRLNRLRMCKNYLNSGLCLCRTFIKWWLNRLRMRKTAWIVNCACAELVKKNYGWIDCACAKLCKWWTEHVSRTPPPFLTGWPRAGRRAPGAPTAAPKRDSGWCLWWWASWGSPRPKKRVIRNKNQLYRSCSGRNWTLTFMDQECFNGSRFDCESAQKSKKDYVQYIHKID